MPKNLFGGLNIIEDGLKSLFGSVFYARYVYFAFRNLYLYVEKRTNDPRLYFTRTSGILYSTGFFRFYFDFPPNYFFFRIFLYLISFVFGPFRFLGLRCVFFFDYRFRIFNKSRGLQIITDSTDFIRRIFFFFFFFSE